MPNYFVSWSEPHLYSKTIVADNEEQAREIILTNGGMDNATFDGIEIDFDDINIEEQ